MGWPRAALPDGRADVAHPPAWRVVPGARDSTTVARLSLDGRVLAYVQLSPAPPDRAPETWARLRTTRERAQGLGALTVESRAAGLRFATGTGACVTDSYGAGGVRFREIACLVAGRHARSVVVAAAPADGWAAAAPDLERVVASLRT